MRVGQRMRERAGDEGGAADVGRAGVDGGGGDEVQQLSCSQMQE